MGGAEGYGYSLRGKVCVGWGGGLIAGGKARRRVVAVELTERRVNVRYKRSDYCFAH